jgi:hypothetical protein
MHTRERRAQFVGNVSNKPALRGDQQLNLRSNEIEVARQISEFVFAMMPVGVALTNNTRSPTGTNTKCWAFVFHFVGLR